MAKPVLLLTIALSVFLFNCKKGTTKEIVTVRDTVYVHDTTTIPGLISDTTTTFIITRHAEKEAAGTDPNLDADGIARANELKRILNNVPVSAIYSTPFNRTKQTAQPLASAKGLSVTEYQPATPYAQLVDQLLAAHRGKVVVIVGHSNTVPDILKEISDNSFNITITETQYDNLFIVSMPDKLKPTINHLKYGKETP